MTISLRATLFVPANRPDRIPKALESGADLVCVDLEDAILADDKVSARQTLLAFLKTASYDRRRLSVRINDPRTELGCQDLADIAASGLTVETLVIPKATESIDLDRVIDMSPATKQLIVLVETAQGLSNVFMLAAHARVLAIAFGSADWSTEIGCSMEWEPLLYARSKIVHAAVAGGAIPLDGAWLDLDDQDGLEAESRRLHNLGFQGRIALHPKQVPLVLRSFSADEESIKHARKVLEAANNSRAGAFQIDGKIIDEPMIKRARQLLDSMGIEYPARGDT